MDDEAPVLRYDPAAGTLAVRLSGGEQVVVAGVGRALPCWRVAPDSPVQAALWLSPQQAEVLGKMIEYALSRVKVSAASRQALEALAPQVAQLHAVPTTTAVHGDPAFETPAAGPD